MAQAGHYYRNPLHAGRRNAPTLPPKPLAMQSDASSEDILPEWDSKLLDIYSREVSPNNFVREEERVLLHRFLISHPRVELDSCAQAVQREILGVQSSRRSNASVGSRVMRLFRGDKGLAFIETSTSCIDFGKGANDLVWHKWPLYETVTCTNASPKKCVIIAPKNRENDKFELTFDPPSLTLKKGESGDFKVKLVFLREAQCAEVCVLELTQGIARLLVVNARSEPSVFGVPLSTLPYTVVDGMIIPTILETLKSVLITRGGLESEGIFRLAPDPDELRLRKSELNRGLFRDVNDINVVAHLIKVWFREMEEPVLNSLPLEEIMSAEGEEACMRVMSLLPLQNQSLINWLSDLMCQVALKEAQNKMTYKNLAIVVAPNLFYPRAENVMENLILSQKSVTLFFNVVKVRLRDVYSYEKAM
jgi:hypothetical protein